MVVVEDGIRKAITTRKAIVRNLITMAAIGDQKAVKFVLDLSSRDTQTKMTHELALLAIAAELEDEHWEVRRVKEMRERRGL